jgi:hypothetical protein
LNHTLLDLNGQGPRAAALGASLLDPLALVASGLRGASAPRFGPEDAYLEPVEDAEHVAAYVREQRAAFAAKLAARAAAA